MDQTEELLTRGVQQILPSKEGLENRLRSGKKIRLYQGFDPSMPSLHLGNLVGVHKLRQFQELGHEVIFLVGDFTGMIGDPTDKSATRPKLTREQTLSNAKKWQQQAGKIIKFDGDNPAKFLFNSSWLDKVSFKDLIEITSNFTVQQMIERDFFQKRLTEGKPIHLHEFLYPIAVAIDCVEMDVDLEIGGSDQMFNMMAGRTLMSAMKHKDKFVLCTKLLVDNQGDKVGKTAGNALFLDSTPEVLFGGIMSFPDEVITLSFELLTSLPTSEVEKIRTRLESGENPMILKKELAQEIVSELHSQKSAQKAQESFEKGFQQKDASALPLIAVPISSLTAGATITTALVEAGVVPSRSEAKRLLDQGAIESEGKALSEDLPVQAGTYRVGKRRGVKFE